MPSTFILSLAHVVSSASSALASGHGPVFGLATPTNPAKGWAVGFGVMSRHGESERGTMARAMVSYGITEDLQVSWSVPMVFTGASFVPTRLTAMMPGTADIEGLVAWRFHRRGTAVGRRVESTVYGGLVVPGPQRPGGLAGQLARAPGVYGAAATGLASRSHYLWVGVGMTRFAEAQGDRRSNVFLYSAVWGYRPPPLRKDYPHWDWRLFVELTGERAGAIRRAGGRAGDTGGHQVWLGPTTLGIYKDCAIEGGVQFPVYQGVGDRHPRERVRIALNVSYFF